MDDLVVVVFECKLDGRVVLGVLGDLEGLNFWQMGRRGAQYCGW